MGFTPSLLKKGMIGRCSSLVHVASGAAIFTLLLSRCVYSCILLPHVGHSSNLEYHCCQLTRQSSCVSNFYRTFKVFIWLSLVGVPANIKSRTCRKEIRNLTTAASLLCPNTAMAHNTKYRYTEEYYYRALLERQTGKQRNDEHN